jgi:hypothetical protein
VTEDFPLDEGFDVSLVAEGGLEDVRRDPLKWFRYSSKAQRDLAKHVAAGMEVYLRAGNQAGKTTVAAYVAVALARGASELGGVRLPVLDSPCTGAVLGKSYKQMAESSIKALREALGDWPHKLEMGSQGTVIAIRVKPERSTSDDWKGWSRILILPQDGEKPVGMRLDWAWADEPPKEDYWHELRARGKANRPFLRFITMTPEDRSEWAWLEREFAGCGKPGRNGRIELRLSVFDNKALGAAHLKELEQAWHSDPLLKARLYGEYVDMVGQCPFDSAGLARWEERIRPPLRSDSIALGEGFTPFLVDVWFERDEAEEYFVLADPSMGIKDEKGEHDPGGVIVVSRGTPRLVARWSGYAPAYQLGRLAKALAERYNRALVVWERNSGYGEPFYMGLGGYGNVYLEHHQDAKRLTLYERLGWQTNATSRGAIVGALQKAVIQDGLVMLSGEALSSMRGFIMQRTGKVEAGHGRHDEDVILLGLACHLLETLPFYRVGRSVSDELEGPGGAFHRREERDYDWVDF